MSYCCKKSVNVLRQLATIVLTYISTPWAVAIVVVACGPHPEKSAEGFILKKGEGEPLLNGIVVKASPKSETAGSILVEQTFQKGGTTNLHIHDQGDELFYIISGNGTATLGDQTVMIGPGDVIFVPKGAVHRIENLGNDEPLTVVFFMDSPELVDQFRGIHERVTSQPDHPITAEEKPRFWSELWS
jgi:mannose-6-phosphate isomerase-like protein (cupin superfamily)